MPLQVWAGTDDKELCNMRDFRVTERASVLVRVCAQGGRSAGGAWEARQGQDAEGRSRAQPYREAGGCGLGFLDEVQWL